MVYMYHSFLIHSSVDGHLDCFHVLAIINSAVMNIGVHVSLSDLVFSVCMPRRRIQKLYRQAKAERIQHHQTSFSTNAKGSSVDKKHRKVV